MIKSYKAVSLAGETVILRLDLNVSFKNHEIVDMARLERAADSIRLVNRLGAHKTIILSHLGRPKGKPVAEYSLRKIAIELSNLLGQHVELHPDPVGQDLKEESDGSEAKVVLLENLRFWPEEEANDSNFAAKIARFGTVYINDAFSVSHRAHASVCAITQHLPSYMGRMMLDEVSNLERSLSSPQKPVLGIVGGAKISTKINLLKNLLERLDYLFVGGAMANTFLQTQGYSMGKSVEDENHANAARSIISLAAMTNCQIILPQDIVVAESLQNAKGVRTVPAKECPDDVEVLDIGSQTVADLCALLPKVKTVLWNGPLGAFEYSPFDQGSIAVARAVAEQCELGTCIAVAGGGDTTAVLEKAEASQRFTYVSLGGGAFLEWLEKDTLPGIDVLKVTEAG